MVAGQYKNSSKGSTNRGRDGQLLEAAFGMPPTIRVEMIEKNTYCKRHFTIFPFYKKDKGRLKGQIGLLYLL